MSAYRDRSPLVTVVTVTYNSGKFVRDAIESVLAQEFTDFEYIILDDSSNDDSWEIISGFSDSRIITYRNEKNLGEYANRNKAISLAKGQYLLFIDGDDILLKHGLAYYVTMATKFPEAGMLVQKGYFNNIVFPALFGSKDLVVNHYCSTHDLLTSSFASNFFRLNVLKEVGGLSTNYRGGDNHIRLRIASQYPVAFIAGYVSWPRETPGSASSRLTVTYAHEEMARYTREFMHLFNEIEKGFGDQMMAQVRSRVARFMLGRLLRFRFEEFNYLKDRTGIGLWDALRSVFTDHNFKGDILARYSPVSPYKNDYLR